MRTEWWSVGFILLEFIILTISKTCADSSLLIPFSNINVASTDNDYGGISVIKFIRRASFYKPGCATAKESSDSKIDWTFNNHRTYYFFNWGINSETSKYIFDGMKVDVCEGHWEPDQSTYRFRVFK